MIATLVALCCAAVAIPVAAQGTTEAADAPATAVSSDLLDARQQVADINQDALEDAPAAVGASCGATVDVPGIGDACRTTDGLLRVELPDGRSSTIHGMDAPPLGAESYGPVPTARVAAASIADIDCVDAATSHYTLVYARPSNVASRFADIAPKLRTEAYKISAFIDAESQSVDPKAGRHLPFSCDAGTPRVLNATLGAGSAVNFDDVVSQLTAQGYDFNSASSTERYLVYVDAPSAGGAAGTGHVFTSDSRADETNSNNKGGLFAMQYNFVDGGSQPRWDVLVHELSHTMGAVVNDAPHATGSGVAGTVSGHCNDGQDVMCYADGGGRSAYVDTVCSTMVLDCGRDDYFNPAPAAGSYLATHWNMAAAANHWLRGRSTGDLTAPTAPGALTQTGASNSAIGLSWTPASDNVAVTGYTVSVREPGGVWRAALTTTRRTATLTPLTASTQYEVSVTATDPTGNVGAAAVIQASTNAQSDTTRPSAPGNLVARTQKSGRTITVSWSESTDDVGVSSYEVHRLDLVKPGSSRRLVRGAMRTTETSVPIPTAGLKPGVRYLYEVVARDAAGNVSAGARRTIVVARDRSRPTAPGRLRVTSVGGSYAKLGWSASRDDVGVVRYRIYQRSGSRWLQITRGSGLASSVRGIRVTGLRPGRAYAFRVLAFDAAGNSRASRTVSVRPR